MGKEETLAGLLMELRRGTIVLCVLSQLKQPRYGYDLVKILSGHHMPVEANTLYPLLRRLEGQGLLQSSWETGGAKPRKYYKRTPMGDEVLAALTRHWQRTADSVQKLLEEDDDVPGLD